MTSRTRATGGGREGGPRKRKDGGDKRGETTRGEITGKSATVLEDQILVTNEAKD